MPPGEAVANDRALYPLQPHQSRIIRLFSIVSPEANLIDPHPLDRPVWNALQTGWAALALGDAHALRLDPDYGPFGAAADCSPPSLAKLADLVPLAGELWLAEADDMLPPPRTMILKSAPLHQMVLTHLNPIAVNVDIWSLGEADALEMRQLALLTQPGPFFALTHKLGDFVGIRRDGRLVAMAGERMKLDGFTEVSAVCTHPDHRGSGYAGALMSVVTERILARGETAFLHSYSSNTGAIALYERLGFSLRREIRVTVLSR
jgi:ribosomal protein S18 acetylase RimI-like enzyme